MPLFDPDHVPDVAPEDAVVVVHRFLRQAKAWADEREIPKRLQKVSDDLEPGDAAKLYAWITYAAFTDHAIHELEDGTLDRWFTDAG